MRFFIANGRPLGLSGWIVYLGPFRYKKDASTTADFLLSVSPVGGGTRVGSGDENEVVPATRATSGDPADTHVGGVDAVDDTPHVKGGGARG